MKNNFEEYLTEIAPGLAASAKATVFLLTCMDYRYAHRIVDLMDSKGLRRKYDIFVLAGAAAGANQVEKWRDVLIEHVKTARLVGHPIDRIMILEHRDCGAYREFFGLEWADVTPPVEFDKHLEQVELLRIYLERVLHEEIPNLTIDAFLLPRDEDDRLVSD